MKGVLSKNLWLVLKTYKESLEILHLVQLQFLSCYPVNLSGFNFIDIHIYICLFIVVVVNFPEESHRDISVDFMK